MFDDNDFDIILTFLKQAKQETVIDEDMFEELENYAKYLIEF